MMKDAVARAPDPGVKRNALANGDRLLIGVSHDGRELPRVLETLGKFSGRKAAGMELREDYGDRAGMGLNTVFYSELAAQLESLSFSIVPLECPSLREAEGDTDIVRKIRAGMATQDQLYHDIRALEFVIGRTRADVSSGYVPPEQKIRLIMQLKGYWSMYQNLRRVDVILDSVLTREDAERAFQDINRKREAYFLERITQADVPIVVLGFEHTRIIRSELPSYRYVEIL